MKFTDAKNSLYLVERIRQEVGILEDAFSEVDTMLTINIINVSNSFDTLHIAPGDTMAH